MIYNIPVSTTAHSQLVDITSKVKEVVRQSKVKSGSCQIFVPHTTAGITINENADPSVPKDILKGLEKAVPFDAGYAHTEGNAAAHIKSTIVGTDKTIFIEDGELRLGTWQGIFFCEFDGPRSRTVIVKVA